jgi:biotin-dependent carboxylase-like uncharacterized protein
MNKSRKEVEPDMFEVIDSGVQAMVQDVGRPGYGATGMPVCGTADRFSLAIANLLVGNDPGGRYLVGENPGDAGIETLLYGLKLKALDDTVIAVTGADLMPMLNGEPLPMWRAVRVKAGDIIGFRQPRAGARAYLAVAGGIDVPLWAGSRGTYIRGSVGGFEGRAFKKGDIIQVNTPKRSFDALAGRRLLPEFIPRLSSPWQVRVVLGPHDYLFLDESIKTFLTTEWKMSPVSDRMGCRFRGAELEFKPRPAYLVAHAGTDPSNVVDSAVVIGGIQVPGGVEPIVLHVDGPSMGGYVVIATVISADLGTVGQMKPGDQARFVAVNTDKAVAALIKREDSISERNIVKD